MNKEKIRLEFKEKGFFKISNFFDNNIVKNLNLEINEIVKKKPNDIIFYKDRNNLIRRMERFYNYTNLLNEINKKVLDFLNIIFEKRFHLFKDKYNFKPPKGEGFFAHYDGIFNWTDKSGKIRKGWHEYADEFINVLILLDDFQSNNGPLEISKVHKGDFEVLLNNTKKNGTPDLSDDIKDKLNFEKMISSSGSIVVFSSKCPHRSSKNDSDNNRGSLYYTYNPEKFGNNYDTYFDEKSSSRNTQSKSLSGELN